MTRAVWVTAQPPDGRSGGAAIRQAAQLRALASVVETDLVVAGRLPDAQLRRQLGAVIEVDASVDALPARRWHRRARHLADTLVWRRPPELRAHRSVRRALRTALHGAEGYDLVCVDSIGLAPLVPRRRTNRWVLNLHNRPSGMALHRVPLAAGARQRWLLRREAGQARRVEERAARAFDLVVTVSHEDAAGLGTGVVVVPNGVDTRGQRPSPLPAAPRLVFTGALYTLPNVDGVVWFAREVLPLVRRSVPEATLDVVGMCPSFEVASLAELPGVEVHPDVTSVMPYLDSARVAVVPLRIGTGTRLKALEAMAAGRPVAGTSIGLEGLGVEHRRTAWVGDDPEVLAEGVVGLLTDDALASALARAGRLHVEAGHDWAEIGRRYASAVLAGLGAEE